MPEDHSRQWLHYWQNEYVNPLKPSFVLVSFFQLLHHGLLPPLKAEAGKAPPTTLESMLQYIWLFSAQNYTW